MPAASSGSSAAAIAGDLVGSAGADPGAAAPAAWSTSSAAPIADQLAGRRVGRRASAPSVGIPGAGGRAVGPERLGQGRVRPGRLGRQLGGRSGPLRGPRWPV